MTKKVNIDIVARDKTKRAIASSKKGLGSLKSAAKVAGIALAAVGGFQLIRGITATTARFEDLKDSLASVTGGAREGAKAFQFVSDFATRSQFGVEELSRSFITLKASGIEPTEKLLRTFTDTAAVTTDGLGTLDAMTRVFSRGVQGGLGLEELNQIADRGVPVFKILEEQLGITRLEVAKFGQTTDGAGKILDALQVGFNKEFGGATETKLDNLSVGTSNLQIALANAAEAFGEAGFRGALTKAVTGLTDFVIFLTPAIATIGKFTGSIINLTVTGFEKLSSGIEFASTKIKEFGAFLGIETERTPIYHDQILRLADGYGILAEKIETDTKPAIQELSQDVLDLQEALEPLGNAFDVAFATADQKLQESEANRKRTLENATQNFKDAKFKEIDFQKMTQKEAQQLTKAGFRQSLQEGAKHNKALFRINQAMNIAEAIMNTATGVTSALKLGPIIGPPLALAIGAMGAVQVATIAAQQPPAQFGGARVANQPFLVGEQGPELFTPATAGTVTPNHQLESAPTHIVFNINTVDAKGFGALLDTRKAQIVNMINSARNQKGQSNIV